MIPNNSRSGPEWIWVSSFWGEKKLVKAVYVGSEGQFLYGYIDPTTGKIVDSQGWTNTDRFLAVMFAAVIILAVIPVAANMMGWDR